jgi:Reverse transcriptase (RNA-dependent DNA polymerase)
LRKITAFRTPSSKKYPHVTWTFRSTWDGLANLPGYYSYLIQKALSPQSKACTVSHIDDLMVFSKTEEDHLRDLDSVLTDLGKQNFLVSMSKFEPFKRQVQFLGHMIDKTNDLRKSYFDKLEPPNTKKSLQSLLGVCNYMSTFVDR